MTSPLETLHRVRDERLRTILRTAKERSQWHARRLAHVDPDAVTGDDLSMIPVMTKVDVMANWDGLVTDRRLTRERAEVHLLKVASEGLADLLGGLPDPHRPFTSNVLSDRMPGVDVEVSARGAPSDAAGA